MELQAKTLKEANELQATANGLQQEMIKEIKTNNRVTSMHSKVMIGLTVAIVFLGIITLLTNLNKTGRYAMTQVDLRAQHVLDTKTSQMWIRSLEGNFDLGTNENPKREKIISNLKTN